MLFTSIYILIRNVPCVLLNKKLDKSSSTMNLNNNKNNIIENRPKKRELNNSQLTSFSENHGSKLF